VSSLRAISLPTQELQPGEVFVTDAYQFPRTRTSAPPWAQALEETARVIARFGFSPTPTILLVSALVVGATLRR
jgi:hypothetical protein